MANAEKLSITLPGELAALIRERVRAGEYASDSDVIREALQLWRERETQNARKREQLRGQIDRSLADPAPSLEAEDVFAELEARYAEK